MILGYLIFGHLLADFVLQPSRLVIWKHESRLGVFVHVLIYFLINMLILLPFLLNGNLWLVYIAFGLAFTHFWIDQAKINYDLKHDKKVLPFIIDQLLHLLSILVAYFFIQNIPLNLPLTKFYTIYSDIRIVIFLSFIVFVSVVVEVYYYQQQREKNVNAKLKINHNRLLTRVIVFSLIYIFFMLLSFYARGAFQV